MEHLLLSHAFKFKKRKPQEAPEGFVYDKQKGAWVSPINSQLLVANENFPSVATKKEDIETGEDQKGH
jgi:hypothetical protein